MQGGNGILAQCDFVERLYVSGALGRIDFGVRRAFLSIINSGPGEIEKIDSYKGGTTRQNASYMELRDLPDALTICMDPAPGKSTLADLALPPSPNENYLSKIATATADIATGKLSGQLTVSLNVEGLHLAEHNKRVPSQKTLSSIRAIMEIAVTKVERSEAERIKQSRQLRRKLIVRERP
jgi:hypothetical protein